MSKSTSLRFPVTVTYLPVTRCQIRRRTVAYRPGSLSEVLTEAAAGPIPKRSACRLGTLPRRPVASPRRPRDPARGTMVGGNAFAAVVSHEHDYALVAAHGETGIVAHLVPLTIGGLIFATSIAMLDSVRRRVPVPGLARRLLGLGVAATLAANIIRGLSHASVSAAVAWPAISLVGSYELLTGIMGGAPAAAPPCGYVPRDATADWGPPAGLADAFSGDLAAGKIRHPPDRRELRSASPGAGGRDVPNAQTRTRPYPGRPGDGPTRPGRAGPTATQVLPAGEPGQAPMHWSHRARRRAPRGPGAGALPCAVRGGRRTVTGRAAWTRAAAAMVAAATVITPSTLTRRGPRMSLSG